MILLDTHVLIWSRFGIRANSLVNFHADPADRIIVSTALGGHWLLTADEHILSWSGNLDRLDARE